MSSPNPNPEFTKLATGVTIGSYRKMVDAGRKGNVSAKAQIADLVRKRFEERYLNPVLKSRAPHGFTILAVCCLMVEALESFRQGWATTDRMNGEPFCAFFQAHEGFIDLRPVAHEFYRAVRCGILHQAETTHGWRVNRARGQLLKTDGTVHWVSAREFAQRLGDVLKTYCKTLETSDWNGPIWEKARSKLKSICKNCGVVDVAGLA